MHQACLLYIHIYIHGAKWTFKKMLPVHLSISSITYVMDKIFSQGVYGDEKIADYLRVINDERVLFVVGST